MTEKELFGISEQLDCSDCVNHGGDWDCDHVQCRKGADTISRRAALDALDEQIGQCNKALSTFDISMKDEYAVKVEKASLVAFRETLEYMPSAQSSLYGYDLRNLIVFADAVNKKGISDSEIEDFVRNARAAWEYAWEEFQRTQKEALDSIMRGDHHES